MKASRTTRPEESRPDDVTDAVYLLDSDLELLEPDPDADLPATVDAERSR
jgi:hypothetical protein